MGERGGATLEAGARTRLEVAYREFGDDVWRAVFAWTGGRRDLADDAVAESFAQAGRRLSEIRDLKPWVFRAAFRIAAGELKRQRLTLPLSDGAEEDAEPSATGMADLLMLASALSARQRTAFVLRDVLGFSSKESAGLSGMSEIAVRVHLHAARRRLRAFLQEGEA